MSVKIDHVHEPEGRGRNRMAARTCYMVRDRSYGGGHPYKESGTVQIMNGVVGAQYLPYTGSWYFFDLTTGKEVGSMHREAFESLLRPHFNELVPDPDCVPVKKSA